VPLFSREMTNNLEAYAQSREVLLTSIITELSADERCAAAWLTGSYGRNNADPVSDMDITVAIAEPYSAVLCARQEQVSHTTTPERLALFGKFGEVALIHENNNNAPEHGTFTFVLYASSALMIDWVLIPQTHAERPSQSLLLFDKPNIPVAPEVPEDPEKNNKAVAEIHAFFWMMTAVTLKYIIRGDLAFVQNWLEVLHKLIREIERRMEGISWLQAYVRGSISPLQATREQQIQSLRELIMRMQKLHPALQEFTGSQLSAPVAEIEFLLSLTDESDASD
jgi:predicted nucleotidyltransferase